MDCTAGGFELLCCVQNQVLRAMFDPLHSRVKRSSQVEANNQTILVDNIYWEYYFQYKYVGIFFCAIKFKKISSVHTESIERDYRERLL